MTRLYSGLLSTRVQELRRRGYHDIFVPRKSEYDLTTEAAADERLPLRGAILLIALIIRP